MYKKDFSVTKLWVKTVAEVVSVCHGFTFLQWYFQCLCCFDYWLKEQSSFSLKITLSFWHRDSLLYTQTAFYILVRCFLMDLKTRLWCPCWSALGSLSPIITLTEWSTGHIIMEDRSVFGMKRKIIIKIQNQPWTWPTLLSRDPAGLPHCPASGGATQQVPFRTREGKRAENHSLLGSVREMEEKTWR